MKALVKAKSEEGIWSADVARPEIGPNDVLIRVRRTAICGTDVHIYNWDEWAQKTIPVPMTVGHEFAGEIVEIGSEVHPEHSKLKIGDRVSAEGHVTCGYCRNCRAGKRHLCRNTLGIGVNRPGAFAEYLAAPAFNVYKLPDDISDDMGAIFDPFGNAVHTALAFDLVGEDVLITGAGPIGVMAAAVARFVGARHVVITDVNAYRLDLARQMGATRAVNVANENLQDVMRDLGMTEGFDVGLEMSGAPAAFQSMLETMNHGGKIAMLGIMPNGAGIDWDKLIFKGLELKGIYGRRMFETWYKMAALLQAGLDLQPIITHRLPVAKFSGRLRHHALGPIRQGRARLVLTAGRGRRRRGPVQAMCVRHQEIVDYAFAAPGNYDATGRCGLIMFTSSEDKGMFIHVGERDLAFLATHRMSLVRTSIGRPGRVDDRLQFVGGQDEIPRARIAENAAHFLVDCIGIERARV